MGIKVNFGRLAKPIIFAGMTIPPRIGWPLVMVLILAAIDTLIFYGLFVLIGRLATDARIFAMIIALAITISSVIRFLLLYYFFWPFKQITGPGDRKRIIVLMTVVYLTLFVFEILKMVLPYHR